MAMDGFRTLEVPATPLIQKLRRRRGIQRSGTSPAPRKTFFSELSAWLRRRGFLSSVRWPDIFETWVPKAVKAIPRDQFDLIVSTFGPSAALAIGYRAKQLNPKAKWICDFRDLWTENHVYPGFWPLTMLERFTERRYLKRADGITTVSDSLAITLRGYVDTAKQVKVFENGFHSEELAALDGRPAYTEDSRLRLVYTGSLHQQQRNPAPLLEAVALLSDQDRDRLKLVFAGPRETFLEQAVDRLGLASQVDCVGPLPRSAALKYQRDADVLLFFEKQHLPSRDGVLTGKLFEYLATGRPIMAIGIDSISTVGALLSSHSCGVALGVDVFAIKDAISRLLIEGRAPNRDVTDLNDVVHKYERSSIAKRMINWVAQVPSLSS
ncbi:glycosyltransferase [soil metagenome]